MNTRQKACSLLCAAALTVGLTLPARATAPTFTDVPEGAWYCESVLTVAEKGLMNGTSKTAFSPLGNVTRATVVTTLWRLEGTPKAKSATAARFPDAAPGAWYFPALAWAVEADLASGYPDGRFAPDDNVTREQLAVFLARYARYKGQTFAEGVLDLYDDAGAISPWAVIGMKHALGAGLMTGTGTVLAPGGLATRGELAAILVRLTTPVKG